MKFLRIYSPVWANQSNTLINVIIDTDTHETILFTASPNDSTEYGPVIYQDAIDGKFGDIAVFNAPVMNQE